MAFAPNPNRGRWTRRRFSALPVLFGAASQTASVGARRRIPIGLQLFSLRRQCEKDLEGTLAWVGKIGFEGIEFAGYYGRSASALSTLLANNGLKCCGAHTPLPEFSSSKLGSTIDFHRALGNQYLIVPGLPAEYQESVDGWRRAADTLNEIAERLVPERMRIGYHNHAAEFRPIDGVLPWTILVEQTRPDVVLQLDIGNARIAGANPVTLLRTCGQKTWSVHVKDYLPEKNDPVIGSSMFDWRAFVRAAEAAQTEWFIIEHDSADREEVRVCLETFQKFVQ